jgi:hypothetical protein
MKRWRKAKVTIAVLLATTIAGLAIGWNNIHSAVTVPWQFWLWLIASACLGFAFPRICWLCPAIFAYTMYFMHIWAIRHGYVSPYVERYELDATDWLLEGILPLIVGIGAGAVRYCIREAQLANETGKFMTYTEHRIAYTAAGGLLRASSQPVATADDLLRSCTPPPAEHTDELVRASSR